MIYKNCINTFNWETKNKKCKTVLSERIKSDVVIIFTYLFVNIDTQITFANWSEPLFYIFFEFNEVTQPTFTCSKSAIETLEKAVIYVQS